MREQNMGEKRVKQEMYYTIFKKTCTVVMGNIRRICFQFP